MIFTKAEISYFRSFTDIQSIELAVPDNEKIGSGITYIVGENNSGKTTVIEGLLMSETRKIRSSELQGSHSPTFSLYSDISLIRSFNLVREGSSTLKEDPKIEKIDSFEGISSRRQWGSGITNNLKIDALGNHFIGKDPRQQVSDQIISGALKDIESDNVKYNGFLELVRRVVPEFKSFVIGFEDSEYIEYVTNNGVKHKSDFLGDGIISILKILAHLFTGQTRPLIIDEPELSLHPLSQKKLLKIIAEYSKQRQIILSTHSPYFISWEYIKNGAKLNKVTKYNDIKSEIFTLKDYSTYESLINGSNWQQPFLMDVVAKEIFFNDNILFVEGQEDVGLLKQENDIKDDVNMFGYGVRGKDSFKFALQLSKDLGIKKAGVILDSGESEGQIKTELETLFPEYKVIQWNKGDIRDKEAYTSKVKEGYFDIRGRKKDAGNLDDYDEKIEVINSYF
ncbi:MAG: AAA family ATPase [Candidatus Gracilibacteria bacterium]|nr:AAA family ATPase [Candidatus Gracilibacteria bacterium]